MIVRTCLLISEDPDDHIEFSEAFHEIADDVIVITVSDPGKAMDLLTLKRCIPDFIILSSDIAGLEPERFFRILDSEPWLRNVVVIAYGEGEPLQSPRVSATIETDISFSRLKDILRRVIEGKDPADTE